MQKKLLLSITFLLPVFVCLSQQTRDHRRTNRQSSAPETAPVKPPPVAGNRPAGAPATSIAQNKWYYIKRAGTKKYMMIAGHKDQTRSMAYLAIEEMQQDNTAQQWRFITADENGNTIYKLQNRKYKGDLIAVPVGLYMELSRNTNERTRTAFTFMMVLNPDKSWYILTRISGNKSALSTTLRHSSHCHPYYDEPVIGGRVIADSECTETTRRDFVDQPLFTGKSDQKWILEEAGHR